MRVGKDTGDEDEGDEDEDDDDDNVDDGDEEEVEGGADFQDNNYHFEYYTCSDCSYTNCSSGGELKPPSRVVQQ
ncbi:hypothetical protein U1Q18_049085 [Sarracenia purpurea var. burkii]